MEHSVSLTATNSELVIGLVSPVGADLSAVTTIIEDRLKHFKYDCLSVRVTKLIHSLSSADIDLRKEPYSAYIRSYQNAGNKLRERLGSDVLAKAIVADIKRQRPGEEGKPARTAYVIRSLKHPAEVSLLRQVYGSGFFLIGVHAPVEDRKRYLMDVKGMDERDADEIIRIDEEEGIKHGQRTRDAFELCDAFVYFDQQDRQKFEKQVWRILDLLYGDPYVTPTQDEYAMFLAYAASLRSADLSRQVGAVVMSGSGEILATGANDVPRYGGGQYWSGDDDQRDHVKGYDSNAERRREIVEKIVSRILTEEQASGLNTKELVEKGTELFGDTGILDITEYGRAVHAEMEALLSCARAGASPRGATVYSTTFPCHNCAKHIIGAGVTRVVYVEPYPKSRALDLHGDAIRLGRQDEEKREKVAFEPFVGVGPRRFMDLYSMHMSSGHRIERKKNGLTVDWKRDSAHLRVPMLSTSYSERETLLISNLAQITEDTDASQEKG